MPPVVPESMDALLQALEIELNKHNPEIVQLLQPGITDEELGQAETLLGQTIHLEMQALYRWHNGLREERELFPGHGFWSLQYAIHMNREVNQQYQEKGLGFLMAREEHWLVLFPDGAGDGYYYDRQRKYDTGGVFYNFREAGYYRYFPSLKNLLKALLECYQKGVYSQDSETDFEMEDKIMNRYSLVVEQN